MIGITRFSSKKISKSSDASSSKDVTVEAGDSAVASGLGEAEAKEVGPTLNV
jgi:hypothetical protein